MPQQKAPETPKSAVRPITLTKAEITKQALAAIRSIDWEAFDQRVREDVAPKVEAYAEARRRTYERTLQYAVN